MVLQSSHPPKEFRARIQQKVRLSPKVRTCCIAPRQLRGQFRELDYFFFRTNWLIESPSRYVREYTLPQIPPWSRVFDNPINEDNDDPITLQETAGSLFIYLVGIGTSCVFFCLEYLYYYIVTRFGEPADIYKAFRNGRLPTRREVF